MPREPGWRPAVGGPARQPDPRHAEGGEDGVLEVTARHGCAERDWRHATALVDDVDGVELMLALHALREAPRWCVQCGVLWPCVFWRAPRRKRPISWFAPR